MWCEFVFVHVCWSVTCFWLSPCLSFSVCAVLRVCYAGRGWLITWWTAGWLRPQWAPVPTKTITKPAWPPTQGSSVSRARALCERERAGDIRKCTFTTKCYNIFLLFRIHGVIKCDGYRQHSTLPSFLTWGADRVRWQWDSHFVPSWPDISPSTLDISSLLEAIKEQRHRESIYLIKTLDDHLFAHSKCCSMCMDYHAHFSLPVW